MSPGSRRHYGSLVPLLSECREAIRACRSRVEIMLVAFNNLMPYGAADCDLIIHGPRIGTSPSGPTTRLLDSHSPGLKTERLLAIFARSERQALP